MKSTFNFLVVICCMSLFRLFTMDLLARLYGFDAYKIEFTTLQILMILTFCGAFVIKVMMLQTEHRH